MGARWQRFTVQIPAEYKPAEREAIGQEIIDYIRKRTLDGKDKNDSAWRGPAARYTPRYKAFKAALVGGGDKVNIRLSGDTLAAMQVLSESKGKIMIGYENGTEENAKADGNIRGTYGQSKPIPGKARDYLGISRAALDRILSKYPLEDREESKKRAEIVEGLSEKRVTPVTGPGRLRIRAR